MSKRPREEDTELIEYEPYHKQHKDKSYWTLPTSSAIGPNDPTDLPLPYTTRFDALAGEHDQIFGFLEDERRKGNIPPEELSRLARDADAYTAQKAIATPLIDITDISTWNPITATKAYLHKAALGYGLGYVKPFLENLGLIDPLHYITPPRKEPKSKAWDLSGPPLSAKSEASPEPRDISIISNPPRAARRLFPNPNYVPKRPPLHPRTLLRLSRKRKRYQQ